METKLTPLTDTQLLVNQLQATNQKLEQMIRNMSSRSKVEEELFFGKSLIVLEDNKYILQYPLMNRKSAVNDQSEVVPCYMFKHFSFHYVCEGQTSGTNVLTLETRDINGYWHTVDQVTFAGTTTTQEKLSYFYGNLPNLRVRISTYTNGKLSFALHAS